MPPPASIVNERRRAAVVQWLFVFGALFLLGRIRTVVFPAPAGRPVKSEREIAKHAAKAEKLAAAVAAARERNGDTLVPTAVMLTPLPHLPEPKRLPPRKWGRVRGREGDAG